MSSASLVGKHSLRKSQCRNIETSSTSITSAPTTTSESKLADSSRMNDKSMRSKQRDSSPDIEVGKGNQSVRASNFELSSSANVFKNTASNDRQLAMKTLPKSKIISSNVSKSENRQMDDKVLEMMRVNSVTQESYRYVNCL